MNKTCKKCGSEFEIFERDRAFYKKAGLSFGVSVPEPALCPSCRMCRRFRFRNERHLHRASCDLKREEIITCYSAERQGRKFPVYCNECWWGDGWDPMKYGVDFDFRRPFFKQFDELERRVPHAAVNSHHNVNSDYTHCVSYLKNCYLMSGANHDEDCYYGTFINHCRDCCDNFMLAKCELCYECLECENCYNLNFSKNCRSCSDSSFLYNCRNCQSCFGCVNLHSKKYYLFNKELGREAYAREIVKYALDSQERIEKLEKHFMEHLVKFPQKYMIGEHNENVTGDGIYHSKNAFYCFDVSHLEDCSYCVWLHDARDCYDVYAWGFSSEMCYECLETGDNTYGNIACISCYGASDSAYSMYGMYSKDLFGCVSVKNRRHCIFNKQYSEAEYKALRERIVAHMKKTGEWGEFFPVEMSPYTHEESMAGDYFAVQGSGNNLRK